MAGEEHRTSVLYKVIADFSELSKKAKAAKKDVADLRKEEKALNSESVKGSKAAEKAHTSKAAAAKKDSDEVKNFAQRTREAAAAAAQAAKATDGQAAASRRATTETNAHGNSTTLLGKTLSEMQKTYSRLNPEIDKTSRGLRRNRTETDGLGRSFRSVHKNATTFSKALDRIGNWRPRLVPPFIALVPVIAGVLALINPLIAGLGAVGAAGLGFAGSLGSIAGAALGAIPALTALLSTVFALKMAFGGVGNAFKQYSASKNAGGGGGGGKQPKRAELTQTEEITRAQVRYKRAIQDVKFAQEDLAAAKDDYRQRVIALRKEVERAAMSEARAAANSQLARENYANVLADPGSTKGQKMMAAVEVDESKADLSDVQKKNRDNLKELQDLEKKGINGDRAVIMAKRALTDAIWAERDAYLAVKNAKIGDADASTGASGAVNLFKKALDELSPSARSVVLQLIAMEKAFKRMKRTVQEAYFSEIVNDIQKLNTLFPVLTTLLSKAAGAAGRVTSRFIDMVTSAKWIEDLGIIADQNVPLIENVGDGLLYILDAMKELTIAAGPFAVALSEGFKNGADGFRNMVAGARESGSLAEWLDVVLGRMQQWWQIVKNIGKTIFNYSAAASDFGQWLTDGFEKMTEGWLKSSDEARKAGSPFKQYLEDIKPLLTELKGLFGGFFSWLGETMSDPENIETMTHLISILRDDLGPSLKNIFDMLSKSGIGESLMGALGSILDLIETFLNSGGTEAFEAFYDTVSLLFDMFNKIIEVTPDWAIEALATSLATIAALRFFGVTKLLNLILAVSKSGAVKAFFSNKGIGMLSKLGGTKFGQGVTGLLGGFGKGGKGGTGFFGKGIKGAGKFLKGSGGKLLKGGLIGAGVGIAADLAGDAIQDGEGGTRDTGGSLLKGAATGAGIGAMVGSVVPGVGTAIGAAVGGGVGTVAAALGIDGPQWKKTLDEVGTSTKNFFSGLGDRITDWAGDIWGGIQNAGSWIAEQTKPMRDWFGNIGENIADWAGDVWGGITGAASWIGDRASEVGDWFGNLGSTVADWAGDVWGGITGAASWIGDRASEVGDWFGGLGDNIAGWAGDVWEGVQDAGSWIADRGGEIGEFAGNLGENIAGWAGDVWGGIQNAGSWIAERTGEIRDFATGLPERVGAWAGGVWSRVQNAGSWISERTGEIRGFATGLSERVGHWAGGVWGRVQKAAGWVDDNEKEIKQFASSLPESMKRWAGNVWDRIKSPGGWLSTQKERFMIWGGSLKNALGTATAGIWDKIPSLKTWVSNSWNEAKNFLGSVTGGGQKKAFGGLVGRFADGGEVPGSGNGDTVRAMLTPGEFVLKKAIVNRIGPDNLARLNAGVISFAQMLKSTARPHPAGGAKDVQFFNSGGLVTPGVAAPTRDWGSDPRGNTPPAAAPAFNVEQLNINNPAPEPASDSLPRSIRKIAYMGAR